MTVVVAQCWGGARAIAAADAMMVCTCSSCRCFFLFAEPSLLLSSLKLIPSHSFHSDCVRFSGGLVVSQGRTLCACSRGFGGWRQHCRCFEFLKDHCRCIAFCYHHRRHCQCYLNSLLVIRRTSSIPCASWLLIRRVSIFYHQFCRITSLIAWFSSTVSLAINRHSAAADAAGYHGGNGRQTHQRRRETASQQIITHSQPSKTFHA